MYFLASFNTGPSLKNSARYLWTPCSCSLEEWETGITFVSRYKQDLVIDLPLPEKSVQVQLQAGIDPSTGDDQGNLPTGVLRGLSGFGCKHSPKLKTVEKRK